jgi:hypothetical protein
MLSLLLIRDLVKHYLPERDMGIKLPGGEYLFSANKAEKERSNESNLGTDI